MRTGSEKLNNVIGADALDRIAQAGGGPQAIYDQYVRAMNGPEPIPGPVVSLAALAADFLIAGLCGFAAAQLYLGQGPLFPLAFYVPAILGIALAVTAVKAGLGLYSISRLLTPAQQLARVAGAWAVVFAGAAAAVFFAKLGDAYSRVWLGLWFSGGLAISGIARLVYGAVTGHWNKNGQFNRHAVLVGGGEPAAALLAALRSSPQTNVEIGGIFDDRGEPRSPDVVAGMHRLGDIEALIDFVRRARVDLLLVTLPLNAEDRLLQLLKRLWILPVDIRLSAYAQRLRYRPRAYSYVGNVPCLDVFDRPLGDWDRVIKTVEDKVIAALALLFLSPFMLLIALAVKLDSKGPVFFKQKRYGFNNELIEIYKFRSMYDRDRDLEAAALVTKGDPRVTRVGRFIRRASIDELPQLFNVLKGDLSLVGPRPHPTKAKAGDKFYDDVFDGYFARHKVKPGITGWAQINGWRGETDTVEKLQRRVEHDLFYIENWSLLFDLVILLRTPFALLKGENAY